jgi:HEAT repeat protein
MSQTVTPSPATDAPYPGLRPYREDEQDNFFGREADSKVLIDKILVHRLTLLFAATGVGKSSLLQASALPYLKSPRGENLDVAYYIDWVSNPLQGVRQAVQQALQASGSWRPEITYTPKPDEKLVDFLGFCALFTRQPLIVVLDQFEEFFRYQRGRETFEPFLEQLTGVISNEDLPVHLVFSMREDFALELDAFKKYMPLSVFGNLYRLEKLGKEAAKEVILSPMRPIGFRYEPELLEQLLQDLLSRELSRDGKNPLADTTESVEPPYLQIVCSQLWEREWNNPDKTLRLSTYTAAGGAKGLLENYIRNTLQSFSEREKTLASNAFDHLISRHGAKMPYTPEDLASAIGAKQANLQAVLEKLARARILRSQNREDKIWYELYHDMFSGSIEEWNVQQKEKMRNRKLLLIGSAATVAILVITLGTMWGVNHFNHHLRLARQEGSRVEVYHGREGWPDPFKQQRYEYETYLPNQDMEPDKRFQTRGILDYSDLNDELTGYRPFAERIHGYIEQGNFSKAVELKDKAFSGSSPELSRDVIRGLFGLKTQTGFGWVKQAAVENKGSTLNDTALSLLQENTLSLPLDELSPFPFFYTQLKRPSFSVNTRSVNTRTDPRLLDKLIGYLADKDATVCLHAVDALGQSGDPRVFDSLANALKAEKEYVRQNAAQALGLIGDPRAFDLLANALKAEKEDVRLYAAEALGLIGDPRAVDLLANALKDEKEDVRQNAAEALGRIGDPRAVDLLANALKDEKEDVRLYAAQALGRIGDPRAVDLLANALKDEDEYVRRYAAQALGRIGDPRQIQVAKVTPKEREESSFKWADFFDDEKLGSISGSVNDRKALLQALNLPVSPERNQQLLTLAQKTDAHLSIRQKAIETLVDSKDASLVKPLQSLKSHPQLNKSIVELEEKVLPPLKILHDPTRKLSVQLAALQRLAKEDPSTAKQEILRIVQQPQEDAVSNLAYRLLGDLQISDNGVIPLLQQRLDALDEQFREWRELRDHKSDNPSDEDLKQIKAAKTKINSQAAFDYAYALTRLDPDIGKKLLTHNLADVRQGAYMGFAMRANIKKLRELDEEREARRDDPVFRHEAFRSIDIGLHRLEILGNNHDDDKELKELSAWQHELEKQPRTTKDDPDDEVLERLQWTTLMMEHYNKLDADFRQKYGKKRVWPEDTLPINQPYPRLR